MSKIIDSIVQASIDSKQYAGVLLAKLEFTPILRVNNTNQSIYWDEAGTGEQEYLGVGQLASISVLPETNELGAVTIQLTITGIPPDNLTEVFSDDYRNKPVYLWYGTLDTDTYAVQGGQTGPVLVFAGLMDYSTVEFGPTCTITVNATSRLADWDRPRGGRFTEGYQRRYIDPTDTGFRYIIPLQVKEIAWGGKSLLDGSPGGGGGGGTSPGDPPIRID